MFTCDKSERLTLVLSTVRFLSCNNSGIRINIYD